MSRSGYSADWEPYDTADWLRSCAYTANTERHLAGRKGQAFLWELYWALTDLPSQELVPDTMTDEHGGVCALGAVAAHRGAPFSPEDPPEEGYDDDWGFAKGIANRLGIKDMMAREVMEENDQDRSIEVPGPASDSYYTRLYREENDHERWARMRRWVVSRLKDIP